MLFPYNAASHPSAALMTLSYGNSSALVNGRVLLCPRSEDAMFLVASFKVEDNVWTPQP
jgi:hypothetical protein